MIANKEKAHSYLIDLSVQGSQKQAILSQLDSKTATLVSSVFKLFKKQELHLVYDPKEQKLIAYDAIVLDLKKTTKSDWNGWPVFRFENQTLCCKIDSYCTPILEVETPTSTNWTRTLQSLPHPVFFSYQPLQLPLGRTIALKDFVKHPLFKNTIEKYSVFSFLSSFVQKTKFLSQYNSFLEHIKQENWFKPYLSNPKGLANLSLIAFLEEQILQEDLFVIHMVASAIQESSEEDPTKFVVLQKDNASDYLKAAHYPPFDTSAFSTTKTDKELEQAKQKVLLSLRSKSPVQRTSISYCISKNSIEHVLITQLGHHLGYNEVDKYGRQRIVLVPPSFCLELYEITSSLKAPPPSEHTLMFGFNNDKSSLATLTKGRPISIASPLFLRPDVHGHREGKQLAITIHDLLYHLAIDWQNPHCRLFIRLGEAALANNSSQDKSIKKLAILLLDRDCSLYTEKEKDLISFFWRSLASRATIAFPISAKTISSLKKAIPLSFFDPKTLDSLLQDYQERAKEDPSKENNLSLRSSFLKEMFTKKNNHLLLYPTVLLSIFIASIAAYVFSFSLSFRNSPE